MKFTNMHALDKKIPLHALNSAAESTLLDIMNILLLMLNSEEKYCVFPRPYFPSLLPVFFRNKISERAEIICASSSENIAIC